MNDQSCKHDKVARSFVSCVILNSGLYSYASMFTVPNFSCTQFADELALDTVDHCCCTRCDIIFRPRTDPGETNTSPPAVCYMSAISSLSLAPLHTTLLN